MPVLREFGFVLAFIVLAVLARRAGKRIPRPVFSVLDRLARGHRRAVLVTAILAFAGSGWVALCLRMPVPGVHDEFGHLLIADTFAHGRLTNPTHPLWHHFETVHVMHEPTYTAKFPPAQAVLLALGQITTGEPGVGLWLGAALLCGSLTWALLGWLPGRWAALGGLLAVLRFGVAGPWSQSFWGGAVAGAGGALVLGSLPRLLRARRGRDAAILGAGLAILAFSRPFEGLLVSLPAGAVLIGLLIRDRRAVRLLVPLAAVLVPLLGLHLLYDRAVTGDPLTMPYQVHARAYNVVPPFLLAPERPEPEYRHDLLRRYHTEVERGAYVRQQRVAGYLREAAKKVHGLWWCFAGSFLLLPLLLLPLTLARRRYLLVAATAFLMLLAMLDATYRHPHYVAPGTAAFLVLIVAGLRRISLWRTSGRGRPGRILVVGLLAGCFLEVLPWIAWYAGLDVGWHRQRARMSAELLETGERHLVVVRYAKDHDPNEEWIQNGADLEEAPVLWAREMDPEANRRLLAHYAGRTIWLLEIGFGPDPPRLAPYPR